MVSKDKIRQLLGSGLNAETVALAVGCEASYISQLLSDESFKEEVQLARLQNLTAATERDKKYDELEDVLLGKLKESIQWITKPRDILMSLAVLNKAERRGAPPTESAIVNNAVVNIALPTRIQMEFTVNSHQQVVAVGNETMITMDSRKLQELAAARIQEKQATALLQSSERIPSDETNGHTKGIVIPIGRKSGQGVGAGAKLSADATDEELLQALGI